MNEVTFSFHSRHKEIQYLKIKYILFLGFE
jgi:hypothetical protein